MSGDGEVVRSLDQILHEQREKGKPAMPILLHYFDDDLFDIYAGCFNAAKKPATGLDDFELCLAYDLLQTETKMDSPGRRFLIRTISELLS